MDNILGQACLPQPGGSSIDQLVNRTEGSYQVGQLLPPQPGGTNCYEPVPLLRGSNPLDPLNVDTPVSGRVNAIRVAKWR